MVKVLVVDDTTLERRRAGALLEKHCPERDLPPSPQLEVLYAGNGKEALDIVRRNEPELVLTDLMMPEMNGLELVKGLREHFAHVPVVLMTAHGSEEIAALALQAGAAGYVPKRHLARDLRETVDTVLDLTQADRELRHALEHLSAVETRFQLPGDLAVVGPVTAHLQYNLRQLALFDSVDQLRVSVAVREALVNAVLYGCLELPSQLRDSDESGYHRLVAERRQQSPYRERRIDVLARDTPRGSPTSSATTARASPTPRCPIRPTRPTSKNAAAEACT